MKLTIYTDESFSAVREVREVPRMKVPYRTAEAVLGLFVDMDLDHMDTNKGLAVVLKNTQHITAVVRATFGLPEEDLPFIDLMELSDLAREIITYVMGKIAELGAGDDAPNAQAQAQAQA